MLQTFYENKCEQYIVFSKQYISAKPYFVFRSKWTTFLKLNCMTTKCILSIPYLNKTFYGKKGTQMLVLYNKWSLILFLLRILWNGNSYFKPISKHFESQHASQVFLASLSFDFLPFFTFLFEVIAQRINVLSTKMAWLGDDGDLEIYAIVFVACRFGLFLLKFI